MSTETQRATWLKYSHSVKGKARTERYNRSEAHRAASRRWNATVHGKILKHLNNQTPNHKLADRLGKQERKALLG